MRPFEWKGIGKLYLKTLLPPIFLQLMYRQGITDRQVFGIQEAKAYVQLLKKPDQGKAFLRIMRGFEPTLQKENQYRQALQKIQGPIQIVWGEKDTALTIPQYAQPIQEFLNLDRFHTLPAKHFLQVTALGFSVAMPSTSARCAASRSRGLQATIPSSFRKCRSRFPGLF